MRDSQCTISLHNRHPTSATLLHSETLLKRRRQGEGKGGRRGREEGRREKGEGGEGEASLVFYLLHFLLFVMNANVHKMAV